MCILNVAQASLLVARDRRDAGKDAAATARTAQRCPAAEPLISQSTNLPPRAAFTLIELLVTVVILATGIVLVLRAFNTAVVALDQTRASLESVWLARNRLAELQIEAVEQGRLNPGRESGRGEGRTSGMLWETQIERLDLPSGGNTTNVLYKVRVAAWREKESGQYSAATYVRCRER